VAVGNKRKLRLRLGISARFRFIKATLILMIISFLINCYIYYQFFHVTRNITVSDVIPYSIFQLNYSALNMILIITIVWIMHYGFGALARMESIIDKIISGDYSCRMYLRKYDAMRPFAEKLNKVLNTLEEAKK
jgi:hypothetical protein